MSFYDIEYHFRYWATFSKFYLSMKFIFQFQYKAEVIPKQKWNISSMNGS
ncbi:unnamed protein product [Paramecium sonneborni]|uniref:Uncharacterized protein n=1 Tax=Paramecium sonneborni TaxID=65129 RepID=A0A8S1P5M3_9CILI|nr:unnamed protein product [Paramecium sonneborni]